MKFYAVAKGHNPGVYTNWDDAKKQVENYPHNKHMMFNTLPDALQFIQEVNQEEKLAHQNTQYDTDAIIYVGGFSQISEEKKTVLHSMYYLEPKNTALNAIKKIHRINLPTYEADMHLAELSAVIKAVEKAISMNFKNIEIHYVFNGVNKFATGEWFPKTKYNLAYVQKLEKLQQKINLVFVRNDLHANKSKQAYQMHDLYLFESQHANE